MSEGSFLLRFWGREEERVMSALNCHRKNVWFKTEKERADFKRAAIKAIGRDGIVVFAEYEGEFAMQRTVAYMTLTLPDGRSFRISYEFGFGYPEHAAHYMFHVGNYACDCNLSLFLGDVMDIAEFDCGDTIKMTDFEVRHEGSPEDGDVEIGTVRLLDTPTPIL